MRQRRWIELFSDYECEIRYHLCKENVVADALSKKERVKHRHIRVMAMTIQSGVKEMILAAHRDVRMVILNEAHKSRYSVHPGVDKMYHNLRDMYWWPGMKRYIAIYVKIGEGSFIGPELVLETIDKVVFIKEKLKAARDHQKSYAEKRRKPLEFEVGERVLLKVSPWKGVVCFGKKGKLAPRYVGPFKILERIGLVAYRLRLLEELNSVHDNFHVSNLKKCLADVNLYVPLDEIKVDKTLRSVEIMDLEIKKLKRRNIVLVKVIWNSKRGPEFT
nr:putative reverse transcriptase domain-containing protein [Tanacetum cinerariifolium]